jgi:hypothetical protein
MSSVLQLNQPEASLAAFRPLATGFASLLPGKERPRVIVAQGDDRLLAFAHFVPEPPDHRWQLVTLGASTGVYNAAPLWQQLLERSVVAAGLRGVKRLYARPPVDSEADLALTQVGFQPYATESIFTAKTPVVRAPKLALRAQASSDTWAIHQLFNAVVPRQVQYAEAFTSHRWEIGAFRAAPAGVATTGWLLEEAYQVVAYARIMSFGAAHVLELIVHPDWDGSTGDVIDSALALAGTKRRVQYVSCAVRGYQQEVASALIARGFVPSLDVNLTVKYTAARVIAPAFEIAGQPDAVLERLPKPKRAPSYLFWQGEE